MVAASLTVLALLCGAWVIYRLLGRDESVELRRIEWLFPLRGRWLRYAIACLVALSLLLCLRQLARPYARPFGAPVQALGATPGGI